MGCDKVWRQSSECNVRKYARNQGTFVCVCVAFKKLANQFSKFKTVDFVYANRQSKGVFVFVKRLSFFLHKDESEVTIQLRSKL